MASSRTPVPERRGAGGGRAGPGGGGGGVGAWERVGGGLERLELELLGRRLEVAWSDHELGHEPRERLVAGREVGARRAQASAQVRGRLARGGCGEVVVEVDLREPRLALVRKRQAQRQE